MCYSRKVVCYSRKVYCNSDGVVLNSTVYKQKRIEAGVPPLPVG